MEPLDDAIKELDAYLDTIGDLNNLTPEQSVKLDALTERVEAYENKLYGTQGEYLFMDSKLVLNWDRHPDFPDAKAPHRAHLSDAGMDIFAAEDYTFSPGEVKKMRTGICVAPSYVDLEDKPIDPPTGYNVPGGWTLAVLGWDKSGIGAKGLKILGGVIDESYRGEIQITLGYVSIATSLDAIASYLCDILERSISQGVTSLPENFYRDLRKNIEGDQITFLKGEKITQLLIQRVELSIVASDPKPLTTTARGAGGFGSTGK